MSPDKLEALRKLAADERTPIEEARNAALQFVRHGGEFKPQSVTIEDVRRLADVAMVREAFGGELDALKREESSKRARMQEAMNGIETERDNAQRERDALRKQLDELRAHGKALLAFVQGEFEKAKEPPVKSDSWAFSPFYNPPRATRF